MKNITDFFEHLECPAVNGIIFPDNTIQLLDVYVDWDNPIKYTVKIGDITSIEALRKAGNLKWNDCAILFKTVDQKNSLEIIAGEGDYGSDGFIGVLDLDSKKLIWLAFFNCSNPFDDLKIIDEYLCAVSTNGCVWKFRLLNPVDCYVHCR